jgi:AraC-like DNA-binding protein
LEQEKINNKARSGWYKYAARQPGFIGHALRLIRELNGQSEEEQRHEFGADEQSFLRLQGMPLPRAQVLVTDANRIAEECGLTDSLAFVRTMIMAQNLERSRASDQPATREFYQAAFDDENDLDQFPEEE